MPPRTVPLRYGHSRMRLTTYGTSPVDTAAVWQHDPPMVPARWTRPYLNTIPVDVQPADPGDHDIERRITSLIRWNAMAMVVKANKQSPGIGGHISTYASAATLFEVGFHHFFRGRGGEGSGDQVYFQGHASPGIYARAYLEGRLGA